MGTRILFKQKKPMPKFTRTQDLFNQGIKNVSEFISTGASGITGLEDISVFGMADIKKIDEHMYTTYSTNYLDENFTIEGVLLKSVFERIYPMLVEAGYWFKTKNLLTEEIYASHIGEERNDTISVYDTVPIETLRYHQICPGGWEIVAVYDDNSTHRYKLLFHE